MTPFDRLGMQKHAVGSLHLYDRNVEGFKQVLDEGSQSTTSPMPAMPVDNPWSAIHIKRSLRKVVSFPRKIAIEIAPSSRHRDVEHNSTERHEDLKLRTLAIFCHLTSAPAGIRTPNQQIMSLLL
jgi:hypothetical protein